MDADYTKQLNAIVQALNRPAPAWWLIPLTTFVGGLIGGSAIQALVIAYNTVREKKTIKPLLYRDLAKAFEVVHMIVTDKVLERREKEQWRQQQYRTLLKFSAREHIRSRPQVYMQLDEYESAEKLYEFMHDLTEDGSGGGIGAKLFLQLVSREITTGRLKEKEFEKVLGRRFKEFMEQIRATEKGSFLTPEG